MTRREAQLILNVREGAPTEKIRENHRKLMLANHPDNSNLLRRKMNE
jgi:DnaJ family protein C protein 19